MRISKSSRIIWVLSLTALLALASLTGCSPNGKSDSNGVTNTTGSEQAAPTPGNNTDSEGSQEGTAPDANKEQILSDFDEFKAGKPEAKEWLAWFDEHLAKLPKEDADQLVRELLAFYEMDLGKVQDEYLKEAVYRELGTLEWPITEESLSQIGDEAVRQTITDHFAGGYKLQTVEGMIFPIVDYGKVSKYAADVTEPMGEYLKLLAMESDARMASDGGLVITWDELAERAVAYEAYFKQYTDTPESAKIKEQYENRYLPTYFNGLVNTPIYDYDTFKLHNEVKASYENTIKKYPDSETAKLAQQFMDILKKTDWKVYDGSGEGRKDIPEVKQFLDSVLPDQ